MKYSCRAQFVKSLLNVTCSQSEGEVMETFRGIQNKEDETTAVKCQRARWKSDMSFWFFFLQWKKVHKLHCFLLVSDVYLFWNDVWPWKVLGYFPSDIWMFMSEICLCVVCGCTHCKTKPVFYDFFCHHVWGTRRFFFLAMWTRHYVHCMRCKRHETFEVLCGLFFFFEIVAKESVPCKKPKVSQRFPLTRKTNGWRTPHCVVAECLQRREQT